MIPFGITPFSMRPVGAASAVHHNFVRLVGRLRIGLAGRVAQVRVERTQDDVDPQ